MSIPTALPNSCRIVLDAVVDHLNRTGLSQKTVAIDVGLKPNYLTMVKKGSRPSLARVPGFERALGEDIDGVLLTATILCEQYPEEDAQQAIADMIAFMSQQPAFENELLSIASEVREEDEKSGLTIPEVLPEDIRDEIKRLLKQAVQRATDHTNIGCGSPWL